jgi:hypothetical protein
MEQNNAHKMLGIVEGAQIKVSEIRNLLVHTETSYFDTTATTNSHKVEERRPTNVWREFDTSPSRTKLFQGVSSLSQNSYFGPYYHPWKFVGVILFLNIRLVPSSRSRPKLQYRINWTKTTTKLTSVNLRATLKP